MKLPLRQRMMHLFLAVAAGVILAGFGIRLFEDRLVYFPTPFPEGFGDPAEYGLELQDVYLETADNVRLHSWFLEKTESSSSGSSSTEEETGDATFVAPLTDAQI